MREESSKNQYPDLKKAEKRLRDAIKVSPYNVNHYIDLAAMLRDSGKPSEAVQLLLTAKDNFTGKERSTIENQIERISGAEDVWRELVLAYTQHIEIDVPSKYCGHEGSEELLDEKLWEYADGIMEEHEDQKFWAQTQKCTYCMAKLIKIQRALDMAQKEPVWSYEKVRDVIEKTQREKTANALMVRFAEMVKKSPADLGKKLQATAERLENLFRTTFAYPAPSFSPVFGEHPVTVLSPFGKVRYPIIFEWHPYEDAEKYVISIEDADWSQTTDKTRVEVDQKEVPLIYGNEYMWELKVMKGDEIIEEENGFFSLLSEEELTEIELINSQIKDIIPDDHKFILWGGILEEKEFYMNAIEKYKQAHAIEPSPGIAYRIACCYDKVELEELRDEWNKKITENP